MFISVAYIIFETITVKMSEKLLSAISYSIVQLLYSLVLISPFFLSGITMAYPAIALPQMKLDINDASWFGSIPALLSTFGTLLVGISIDTYGRRSALLLTVLPCTIGWFLLYRYSQIAVLLCAQVLIGITFGAIGYPSQVYAGECVMVNGVHLRSYFAASAGLTTSFGTFVTFLLGYFLSHQHIAALAAIISFASFLSIYFCIPESPTWLYLRGRLADAHTSQIKLGIRQPILHVDGQRPRFSSENLVSSAKMSFASTAARFFAILTRKDVYKPLLIMSLIFVMVLSAGGMTITTYMVQVLQAHPTDAAAADSPEFMRRVSNSTPFIPSRGTETSYKYSVVSGGLILIANFCAFIVVIRTGVVRLTEFALFWAGVGMALMGYSTWHINDDTFWSTLHVISVWLVAFMFNFGPVNVTWSTLGDVFPTDAKGFASVCVTVAALTLALSNKLYPYLFNAYGGSLYYVYAVIILTASFFCHLFLPESVGRTLDQINKAFL